EIVEGLELGHLHLLPPSRGREGSGWAWARQGPIPLQLATASRPQVSPPSRTRKGGSRQSSPAITPAVSIMRLEKPHSLSYQLTTRASLPSSTAVSRLSTVELAG